MSRDLGRDVPDLEKLYARKLWADFPHPKSTIFSPLGFHRLEKSNSSEILVKFW